MGLNFRQSFVLCPGRAVGCRGGRGKPPGDVSGLPLNPQRFVAYPGNCPAQGRQRPRVKVAMPAAAQGSLGA